MTFEEFNFTKHVCRKLAHCSNLFLLIILLLHMMNTLSCTTAHTHIFKCKEAKCIFQVNKSSEIKNTLQKGPIIADYDSLEIGLNTNFSISLNYLERNISKNKCVTLIKGWTDRRSTKPGTRYHPEISYQYDLTQRVTILITLQNKVQALITTIRFRRLFMIWTCFYVSCWVLQ